MPHRNGFGGKAIPRLSARASRATDQTPGARTKSCDRIETKQFILKFAELLAAFRVSPRA
jgi:hypothetical protein